jgi:hypothetical protein
MMKIIRKLNYTSDCIVACVTEHWGQLCKKKTKKKPNYLYAQEDRKLNGSLSSVLQKFNFIQIKRFANINGVYPSTFGTQCIDKDAFEHKHSEKWKCEPDINKANPKFGTWRRTLPGRIYGGMHMRNCGVSSSIQSRCKAAVADIHSSLVTRQLKNIRDRNVYHTTRKQSNKSKERQAILRRARFSNQEIIMEKDKTYVKTFSIYTFLLNLGQLMCTSDW